MNKYQKALNELRAFSIRIDPIKRYGILQELVDIYPEYLRLKAKATPKKPTEDDTCPNCKSMEIQLYDYFEQPTEELNCCPNCGQLIDWSENNE